jgi:hypothetical protein
MVNQYRTVPPSGDTPRNTAFVIRQNKEGKTNNTGTVTLADGSSTTTVTDRRAGADSVITFMPTTANAASDLPNLYVSSRSDGQFELTHTNNSQQDRTYGYVITG